MRNFIIYYHAQFSSKSTKDNEHTFIWGDIGKQQKNYPNKETILKELKQLFTWVHIISISEVTKEDYEEYYKK